MTGKRINAITDVTDNSGGTASKTIAVIGATYDQAEVRNAVATLAAEIQFLKDELRDSQLMDR